MSKRNISYIKPQDPSFLAKLKAEIGYKEGPTVETKKQKLRDSGSDSSGEEERPEREDEKPQVVVLQSGDLNAEEAEKEQARIVKETNEAPADLTKPIIFNKNKTKGSGEGSTKLPRKSKKPVKISEKLSFNYDSEEESY